MVVVAVGLETQRLATAAQAAIPVAAVVAVVLAMQLTPVLAAMVATAMSVL